MELNVYNSFILAGVIQGIILSVFILGLNKHRTKASLYLGLLILFLSLTNLLAFVWEVEWVSDYTYAFIYLPISFLTAPFLYFFVMNYLESPKKTIVNEKFLYLPFTVLTITSVLYKFSLLLTDSFIDFHQFMYSVMVAIDRFGDIINICLWIIVITVCLSEIKKYSNPMAHFDSKIIKSRLFWLNILLILLLLLVLLWSYFTIQYIFDSEFSYDVLMLAISIIIYCLGYIGIHKIGVNEERKKIRAYRNTNRSYSIMEKKQSEHISSFETILKKDKKFLDPNLTLQSMADQLNLSKGHLSRIIHTELNTGFSDYINELRITEAKRIMLHPDFTNYTLVAIGLEAGFNSKSTFYSTFKKFTGQTPFQFQKNNSN